MPSSAGGEVALSGHSGTACWQWCRAVPAAGKTGLGEDMLKSGKFLAAAVVACAAYASAAQAATFTINYCPGDASCPANLSEASLTFDEILTGADPNDYNVTIAIVGGPGAPQFIDTVQFSIAGVDTPTGYEARPTLVSAPLQGAAWSVYWDVIAGNPADCSADTSNGQGVC